MWCIYNPPPSEWCYDLVFFFHVYPLRSSLIPASFISMHTTELKKKKKRFDLRSVLGGIHRSIQVYRAFLIFSPTASKARFWIIHNGIIYYHVQTHSSLLSVGFFFFHYCSICPCFARKQLMGEKLMWQIIIEHVPSKNTRSHYHKLGTSGASVYSHQQEKSRKHQPRDHVHLIQPNE